MGGLIGIRAEQTQKIASQRIVNGAKQATDSSLHTFRGPEGPQFTVWQLVCGHLINCKFKHESKLSTEMIWTATPPLCF